MENIIEQNEWESMVSKIMRMENEILELRKTLSELENKNNTLNKKAHNMSLIIGELI